MPFKDKVKAKEYQSRWNKQYYKANKDKEKLRIKQRKQQMNKWFRDYKSKLKCAHCEENHPHCLEFHHVNPLEKDFNVWEIGRRFFSKKRILDEINKCIVLCANCHRKLHAKRDIS